MNDPNIRVLHIDSEKGWRGGQQQAAYLIERMHNLGFATAMVSKPGSAMESYCRDNGLPFYPVSMHGELDFTAGYRIAGLCRKHGFNILHLHSAHALATGLWARMFYKKLRLIAVRRVDFPIKKNKFSRFKYTTSLLDKIVCISHGIKKVLLSDGIEDERLVTIHSGVDLKKFDRVDVAEDFRKTIGVPGGHLLVGTVAAMAAHKDYPNLLQAAAIIIENHDNVTFCAVGNGPDEEAVQTLAKELGLGSRFIFTGFRKDVGRFLKIFDIFVLASYLEGLGTSILDAQALGLPVVACRTGGIPEIVYDGDNGCLVPPRDSDALARAISDLVDHPEKRKAYGERALETVQSFSIEQTVEKNIALYKQILSHTIPQDKP
ncbi:MAG: glycosyltransferase [Desulfobacteraceae bacterium]|jgi:glycosyltransferase involved in cell wall biosynthesis